MAAWRQFLIGIKPQLYAANNRFDWSGIPLRLAFDRAAIQLEQWLQTHHVQGPELFAHSHGGTVAMLASHRDVALSQLVLLSCPVLPQYLPNFSLVNKVVSFHVNLDLVILLTRLTGQRAGQRFQHPNIDEHVINVWFNHRATYDPSIWQQERMYQFI